MSFLSALKFYPQGKQKYLHPHYYVYKCFPQSKCLLYTEIEGTCYTYSDTIPIAPNDFLVEILFSNSFAVPTNGREYSFAMKFSQSIKKDKKRHDLIQHLKREGKDVSNPDEIRIEHFKKKMSSIGAEFNNVVVYNRGHEQIYHKNITKSWVEFRGILHVVDGPCLYNFLTRGFGTGKGYGLGMMILGD
jgi:hypothetical protein